MYMMILQHIQSLTDNLEYSGRLFLQSDKSTVFSIYNIDTIFFLYLVFYKTFNLLKLASGCGAVDGQELICCPVPMQCNSNLRSALTLNLKYNELNLICCVMCSNVKMFTQNNIINQLKIGLLPFHFLSSISNNENMLCWFKEIKIAQSF